MIFLHVFHQLFLLPPDILQADLTEVVAADESKVLEQLYIFVEGSVVFLVEMTSEVVHTSNLLVTKVA